MTAATVTGTLALVLLGVATAPSQAFLAGGLCPRPGQVAARPHGTSDSGVRTLAVASQQTPQALPTVKVKEDDNPQGRRWINEVKTGDKVIGYVADTTNFAAFVDVGVVRRGAQGRVVPVAGFLHITEIRGGYAMENTARATNCEVVVKRGMHLTAYVKDVLPNSGRLTLTLDPSMTKDKLLKKRNRQRAKAHESRRDRLPEKGASPGIGEVTEGYVRQVERDFLLVDVRHAQLAFVRREKINEVTGEQHVDLSGRAKEGDRVTVRIQDIARSIKRGKKNEQPIVQFMAWGGLENQGGKPLKSVAPQGDGDASSSAASDIESLEDDPISRSVSSVGDEEGFTSTAAADAFFGDIEELRRAENAEE